MARRQIAGLRVLVTGASSGIGRELVLQLVRQGAKVVAVARRAERLMALAEEAAAGESLVTVCGDVTHPEDREQAVQKAVEAFGGLDAIINNAGIGAVGLFEESNSDTLRQVMETNFFAPVELIRSALGTLKKGHNPIIVNMSSVLGHRAVPKKSEYCASKFALHGFSDALRAELRSEGIDLLLVSPSTTHSEFFDAALGDGQSGKGKFGGMPADKVARRTLRAMCLGRHETILSVGGTILVWIDRLCPPLANRLVAWFG